MRSGVAAALAFAWVVGWSALAFGQTESTGAPASAVFFAIGDQFYNAAGVRKVYTNSLAGGGLGGGAFYWDGTQWSGVFYFLKGPNTTDERGWCLVTHVPGETFVTLTYDDGDTYPLYFHSMATGATSAVGMQFSRSAPPLEEVAPANPRGTIQIYLPSDVSGGTASPTTAPASTQPTSRPTTQPRTWTPPLAGGESGWGSEDDASTTMTLTMRNPRDDSSLGTLTLDMFFGLEGTVDGAPWYRSTPAYAITSAICVAVAWLWAFRLVWTELKRL